MTEPDNLYVFQNAAEVADVDYTPLLSLRIDRLPNYEAESSALGRIAQTLAENPDQVAKTLVDLAMALTNAHSAGLSVEEEVDGQPMFRWVATAGGFQKYLRGTLPRYFSPCGEVLDRNESMLMKHPVLRYAYIGELDRPVVEVLLVPFHVDGKPIGTLWVATHDDSKLFDSEDRRIVHSLTQFAAAAAQTTEMVNRLREMDERKDKFIVTLAHEMRSPLNSINYRFN